MELAPNRIKELRTARGLSLSDLEDRCGVSRNSINLIENGDAELTLDKMRRIGKALGVSPSALLNEDDVEFRPGGELQAALDILKEAPSDFYTPIARAARTIIDLSKAIGSRTSHMPLLGENEEVASLAEIWNSMIPDERSRVLKMLTAGGFGDAARTYTTTHQPSRHQRKSLHKSE